MERFVWLAIVAVVGCRWIAGRWPWQIWQVTRRPVPAPDAAQEQARHLLGLPAGASRAEIIAAHRRLISEVHPDKGGTSALAHEANAARDTLLAALGVAAP